MPWITAGTGIALVLPSLWSGLHQDDYIVLAVLSGTPPLSEVYPSRLDVFNFFSGPGERMNRMIDLGLLPWWTDRAINLSFWRPLAALTHWIDHVLWRGSPAAMHAHSLLWFAALIVTVTWLYRRLLPVAWWSGAKPATNILQVASARQIPAGRSASCERRRSACAAGGEGVKKIRTAVKYLQG
ncbi:MAG: hypothetical protein ACREF4_02055 [Gammaproteobacteria bacterium]